MPKIDIAALEWMGGTGYPAPFVARVGARLRKRLGDAGGLDQFGVNLTKLEPGAMSALRHWHMVEDEFIYVLSGALTLIEDNGETLLKAGDAAAFKAGVANAHHLVNRTDAAATYLEIGSRAADERAHYPDDDLEAIIKGAALRFTHKDGIAY